MPEQPSIEFVGEDEAAEIAEVEYLTITGCPRFDFQRGACRHSDGIILHIGCNEDPAKLKVLFGGRIINCDRTDWDETMGRANLVDKVFDWPEAHWPFADDSAELVVFNDCLPVLPSSMPVLREAHRIAQRIAWTIPKGTSDTGKSEEGALRYLLQETGWKPFAFMTADWMTEPPMEGWLVEAHRAA